MIKFMGLTRRVCYGRVVYEFGSISDLYTTVYGSRPATGLGSGFGSGFGLMGLILRSTIRRYGIRQIWLTSRTTSYPRENQKFSSVIIFILQLHIYGIMLDVAYIS